MIELTEREARSLVTLLGSLEMLAREEIQDASMFAPFLSDVDGKREERRKQLWRHRDLARDLKQTLETRLAIEQEA